jgi:OmpA-OmpF porin, OOP family
MSEPSDIPPVPPSTASVEVGQPLGPPARSPQGQAPNALRGLQGLWTLLVRLIILGVGVSLGWLTGVLIAQVWPARNPAPPLQEQVMRQSSATVRKVRQLPQWWRGAGGGAIAPASPSPSPPSSDASASDPPASEAVPSAPNSPALAEPEQQQLATALTALQQDLNALETRLGQIEDQVGQPTTGSVESRLQQLEQIARPNAESAAALDLAASTPESEPSPEVSDGLGLQAATPYPEPVFPLVSDRIVLPSLLLFEPEDSILTTAGQQLLDTIVPDLRRYGAVTLLVGSHTDGPLSAEQARQLTFQQALAVQQYLAPQLADTGHRWVSLGYGKTRPIVVGNLPGNQQRNQRIEIGIVPR